LVASFEEAEQLVASFEEAGTLAALRDDVRRRLSLGRRRRRDPESAVLTETEVVVLRLLRTPKSQREIAGELAMSIKHGQGPRSLDLSQAGRQLAG
jgi:DNA-binding NarL/FixJ family response regulator